MPYAIIKFRVNLIVLLLYICIICRSCVATHSDKEPAPVSTDDTLAFLLFRVQRRRALQTRQD